MVTSRASSLGAHPGPQVGYLARSQPRRAAGAEKEGGGVCAVGTESVVLGSAERYARQVIPVAMTRTVKEAIAAWTGIRRWGGLTRWRNW
jgi:hypothetical protein